MSDYDAVYRTKLAIRCLFHQLIQTQLFLYVKTYSQFQTTSEHLFKLVNIVSGEVLYGHTRNKSTHKMKYFSLFLCAAPKLLKLPCLFKILLFSIYIKK
jgi:hypothetical protein